MKFFIKIALLCLLMQPMIGLAQQKTLSSTRGNIRFEIPLTNSIKTVNFDRFFYGFHSKFK